MKSPKLFFLKLTASLSTLFHQLLSFLARVLGSFSWEPPSWPGFTWNTLGNFIRNHPGEWRIFLGCLIIANLAAYAGYSWYHNRPKPRITYVQVLNPPLTALEKELHPNPVVVTFDRSAARLEHVGK